MGFQQVQASASAGFLVALVLLFLMRALCRRLGDIKRGFISPLKIRCYLVSF